MYGCRRIHVPHNSFDLLCRYLPYAEKTQDMINTESIEIIGHLCESFLPPVKSGTFHLFPVIGWKFPVLSFHRKHIRWCTGLHMLFFNDAATTEIYTVSVHSNGDIAF